ncbi:invasion associated locus B family protein [Fluviibacterium sp. DFM31]|uniref:Invasion associated locus B family protein n=1 Tax=Meridianimarinicoccus marinus TaxID=3231483 RepID=A0ABV3L4F7_9RHOB
MKLTPILTAAVMCCALPLAAEEAPLELIESDWSVSCDDRGCVISRSMMEPTVNSRFATLTFAIAAEASFAQMALFVPLGTAVQQPLTLMAGPIQRDYAFTTCLAEGCVVLDRVAMDDLQNMSILPALDIRFFAAEADSPVRTSIPLTGLSAALDQVAEALSD